MLPTVSVAYVRQMLTHKQTLGLSRNNLILVCAQPARDGWLLTVWQISFLPLCQETVVPARTENTFSSGGLSNSVWQAAIPLLSLVSDY